MSSETAPGGEKGAEPLPGVSASEAQRPPEAGVGDLPAGAEAGGSTGDLPGSGEVQAKDVATPDEAEGEDLASAQDSNFLSSSDSASASGDPEVGEGVASASGSGGEAEPGSQAEAAGAGAPGSLVTETPALDPSGKAVATPAKETAEAGTPSLEPPRPSGPKKQAEGAASKRAAQSNLLGQGPGLGSFGMFTKLPGFRAGPGSGEAAGSATGGRPNVSGLPGAPAVSAKEVAEKLQERAEKLQESAKTALNSFLSSTAFGKKVMDSAYERVPVVDTPVERAAPGGVFGGHGSGAQLGGMWKQLTSLQGPAAATATVTAGSRSTSDPGPRRARGPPKRTAAPVASSEAPAAVGQSAARRGERAPLAQASAPAPEPEISQEPIPRSEAIPEEQGAEAEAEGAGKAGPAEPPGGQGAAGQVAAHEGGAAVADGERGKAAPRQVAPAAAPKDVAGPAGAGTFDALRKNLLDTSKNSLKALQTRARHMVSQNKRRYQEDGFDLDMAYITENIIAMGFPAGDMSSGLLGYVEGFYRNHMEDVIRFLESHHKGKYKVYNLCSERLYDAALFEGKVASFPFDDHNCPPLPMLLAFCESCYDWLKGGLDRVCVVHCKAGMARTGLMVCCLLLYLKLFTSAEDAIQYYNAKRAMDGKALVLPSQMRYVHYFHRILNDFDGVTPTPRKCIVRGIRLHRCPYWIRPGLTISNHSGVLFSTKRHAQTRDLLPDDLWRSAPRKGVVVFALPGQRCVAEVAGDLKLHFHDRNGDFYCWLNTSMMQTRQILPTTELDGFDKRRLGSPGFQVEVVVLDHDAPLPSKPHPKAKAPAQGPATPPSQPSPPAGPTPTPTPPPGSRAASLTAAASAAASATGSALQAFYGTVGSGGERKANGGPADRAAKGNPPAVSGALVGGGEKAPAVSSVGRQSGAAEGPEAGGGGVDDIFSDSDGEEEEEGEKGEAGRKADESVAKEGMGSWDAAASGAAPGTAAAAFGVFANALSSSVKDIGGGLGKNVAGTSLRNAMDSLRLSAGGTTKGPGGLSGAGASGTGVPGSETLPASSQPGAASGAPPGALARGGSGATEAEGPSGRALGQAAPVEVGSIENAEPATAALPAGGAEGAGVGLARTSGLEEKPPGAEGAAGIQPGPRTAGTGGQPITETPTPMREPEEPVVLPSSDFKALAAASAADLSVFTFGDDEDFEDFD